MSVTRDIKDLTVDEWKQLGEIDADFVSQEYELIQQNNRDLTKLREKWIIRRQVWGDIHGVDIGVMDMSDIPELDGEQ